MNGQVPTRLHSSKLKMKTSSIALPWKILNFHLKSGSRSFNRKSLHHIGRGQNPYEQAISIIGKTLSAFDEDNLIPCFGFGDGSNLIYSIILSYLFRVLHHICQIFGINIMQMSYCICSLNTRSRCLQFLSG